MKGFRTIEESYRTCMIVVTIAAMVVALLMLSGCTTTKYVPVIEHTTDTLVQRVVERDSIHVHDSIRVSEKGDTVKIERWHTQYRDRWHHDSVYVSKIDSVPAPYPVTEYVERNQGDRSRDSLKMSDHGPVPIDCLGYQVNLARGFAGVMCITFK